MKQGLDIGNSSSGPQRDGNGEELVTWSKFAKSKAEMYEFLNSKLDGMNGTYSSKIEMLSNFMMQAQDDVRDLKSVKNDSSFRLEDIKTLIE